MNIEDFYEDLQYKAEHSYVTENVPVEIMKNVFYFVREGQSQAEIIEDAAFVSEIYKDAFMKIMEDVVDPDFK